MKKITSYFLSSLFLAVIFAPLVIMQCTEEQQLSMIEKRRLAEKPSLTFTLKAMASFPQRYEQYFNDHFGLRDKLVFLYNALFVTFFQTSPKSHTVIGKDKWLYLTAENVITDFMGQNLFDQNKLRYWKQILSDRKEWLNDRGIHYLFIPAPNKVMIYPEYLPDRVFEKRGKTNLEQFLEFLAQPPSFTDVLDLRPQLLAAKKAGQLYHKGDTHWNFDGAYTGYATIIEALCQWFPELRPVPKEQLVRRHEMLSGDLTYTLNLATMYREENWTLTRPDEDQLINYQKFAGYPQPDTPYQKFRRGTLFYNENPSQQRTAVFISDSFGSAMRNFLAPHFKRIVFVKDARFEDLKRLIEEEKPDVVMDLNVARGLHVAMGENIEIRDYVLRKNHAHRQMLLDITADSLPRALEHSTQIELVGDKVRATAGDPQLYFDLPQDPNGTLNIYCEITTPFDTELKLFYQTSDRRNFNEEKKLVQHLRKGRNSFYLRIYDQNVLKTLRLDPGEVPGDYRIDRLTVSSG